MTTSIESKPSAGDSWPQQKPPPWRISLTISICHGHRQGANLENIVISLHNWLTSLGYKKSQISIGHSDFETMNNNKKNLLSLIREKQVCYKRPFYDLR